MRIAGVILAGGKASRMGGGDKCLLTIGSRTILSHVIGRLAPQVDELAISANGAAARFATYRIPVLPDIVLPGPVATENEGPLAGIIAGLAWAETLGAEALLTVSGDTPFIPFTLAADLAASLRAGYARCAVARSRGHVHPVSALWPIAVRSAVEARFRAGDRSVKFVQQSLGAVPVDFDVEGFDAFQGANTPEELEALNRRWDDGEANR